ncbi:hypothetical protein A2282_02375 [candidate division WOR-1 bacterium RIFOXYA12_FULL_36_13]|nr:MAG: hypothetical protein A2282_02375 [candidate division WOR-1 bacterium RIFOXYA12_FULL_36_13]
MKQVFDHFSREAKSFDQGIIKSVPYYLEMLQILCLMFPYPKNKNIKIMDVGVGTGNISYAVKTAFPNAQIVCLDLAPKMLEVAKEKLKGFKGIEFVHANIEDYKFEQKFDAIVSSLTLHHLETDKEKHSFHKKAFDALKKGGIFINIDIVIAPDKHTQNINIGKWKEHILKSANENFVKDRYKKYLEEDRPAIILNELNSLKNVGFKYVDVFFKYFNFAVYGGRK